MECGAHHLAQLTQRNWAICQALHDFISTVLKTGIMLTTVHKVLFLSISCDSKDVPGKADYYSIGYEIMSCSKQQCHDLVSL